MISEELNNVEEIRKKFLQYFNVSSSINFAALACFLYLSIDSGHERHVPMPCAATKWKAKMGRSNSRNCLSKKGSLT